MSRDVYCLGKLWYIDRNIFRCHKQVSPCLFMSCRSFHLFHERQTTHMCYQVSFDLGWACLQNVHVFFVFYFIHTIACKDCSHGHYISHTWNFYLGKQERYERTRNLTLIRNSPLTIILICSLDYLCTYVKRNAFKEMPGGGRREPDSFNITLT